MTMAEAEVNHDCNERPLYVFTPTLSRKSSLCIYIVWTSCNSFDLTLSHHTNFCSLRFGIIGINRQIQLGFGQLADISENYRQREKHTSRSEDISPWESNVIGM